MCLLIVLVRFGHTKWPNFGQNVQNSCFSKHAFWQFWPDLAEMPESFDFLKHGHIRDSQYPLESGGGLGLFVFHKYFLVSFLNSVYITSLWITNKIDSSNNKLTSLPSYYQESSEAITSSEGTPPTTQPPTQLNCSDPVYPELTGCSASVDVLLHQLTSSTW